PHRLRRGGEGCLAQQGEAGMVRPIDGEIADWKDSMNAAAMSIYQVGGKQYGIPYNFGLVGFWYNKDLFADAGISAPPATYAELLDDVGKLQAKGITPITVGAGDKWAPTLWWGDLC